MNRTELAAVLNKPYRSGMHCGIEKIEEPGFENIWFVIPPPPPRELKADLPIQDLAKANRIIQQMPSFKGMSELDRMISHLFVRLEAVQSSRMEGTWSTIDHVLTSGDLYDRKEGRSERASVLGYAKALEEFFSSFAEKGVQGFTSKLVCDLHREIMMKDPNFREKPGIIRRPGKPGSIVFIGGAHRKENSIYNPPPAQHVDRCLREIMNWFSDKTLVELGDSGLGMNLPIRMAVGHAHFEGIHPFSDGNGRVGRMLLPLQMIAYGIAPLYLSGFIEAEKQSYSDALQQAQKKLKYRAIIEFICQAIASSYEQAMITKKHIEALPHAWLVRGALRENSAASRTLPLLITNPIFTVKHLEKTLKVSSPAANRAVQQLIRNKIVRERTGYGRNRVFAAEEVIELLSRSFGEDPEAALERARALLKPN